MGAPDPPADGQMDATPVIHVRSKSRTNGWSWPPHPFQFIAWGVTIYFAVFYYTTSVPTLPDHWHLPTYIVVAVLFILYTVLHLAAVSLNPADPAVRLRMSRGHREVGPFDRKQHRHVIEDSVCHLCQVSVSAGSKHCSACNKCVGNFDHHCKWLNNCVGSRNYRLFIGTLLSAMVGCTVIAAITLLQFVAYFTDKDSGKILKPYQDLHVNGTVQDPVFRLVYAPVPSIAWLVMTALTCVLLLAAISLLTHLTAFHCYLMYKGQSTFEYIVEQREQEALKSRDAEARPQIATGKHMGNRVAPGSFEMNTEESHGAESYLVNTELRGLKTYKSPFHSPSSAPFTPPPPLSQLPIPHTDIYTQKECGPQYNGDSEDHHKHHSASNSSVERRKRRKKRRAANNHRLTRPRTPSGHGGGTSDSGVESSLGPGGSVTDLVTASGHRRHTKRQHSGSSSWSLRQLNGSPTEPNASEPGSPCEPNASEPGSPCEPNAWGPKVERLELAVSSDSESHSVTGLKVHPSCSPSDRLPPSSIPPIPHKPVLGMVRAAGPAREYHTDSAESLVEVSKSRVHPRRRSRSSGYDNPSYLSREGDEGQKNGHIPRLDLSTVVRSSSDSSQEDYTRDKHVRPKHRKKRRAQHRKTDVTVH